MKRAFVLLVLSSTSAFAEPVTMKLAEGAERYAALHREADVLAQRDPRAAASLLFSAFAIELPVVPEARALRADVHARRSELLLSLDPQEALHAARAGLRELDGQPETPSQALLELRRGEALEALGRDAEAVAAYAKAIAIARRLSRAKTEAP